MLKILYKIIINFSFSKKFVFNSEGVIQMLKKRFFLNLIFIFLMCFSCSNINNKKLVDNNGDIKKEWIEEGIDKDFIFAKGIGGADQNLTNRTQKMATSRNAAIVNAQYNMLSLLKGVNLIGGINVEKAIETDSEMKTKIDSMIKNAEIIRTEWTSDDGCVVSIRLSKKYMKKQGLNIEE